MISVLSYFIGQAAQGKALKNPIPPEKFIPDYLKRYQNPVNVNKSLEQQQTEWDAFKKHYRAMEVKAGIKTDGS